jgi:hypothetical protein
MFDTNATAITVVVFVDAGASTAQLSYLHNGTTTAISPVLTPATVSGINDKVACANAAGTSITIQGHSVTCSVLTNRTLTAGDEMQITGGAADGVSTRLSIQLVLQ